MCRLRARQARDGSFLAPPGAKLPVGTGRARPSLCLPLRRLLQSSTNKGAQDNMMLCFYLSEIGRPLIRARQEFKQWRKEESRDLRASFRESLCPLSCVHGPAGAMGLCVRLAFHGSGSAFQHPLRKVSILVIAVYQPFLIQEYKEEKKKLYIDPLYHA